MVCIYLDPSPLTLWLTVLILVELGQEETKKAEMIIPDEDKIADYYDYRQQLDQLGADFREVITHPTYSLPFLQSGRLVKVKYGKLDFGWGVVINYGNTQHIPWHVPNVPHGDTSVQVRSGQR